jgi:ketosteroid isomerase-like protein
MDPQHRANFQSQFAAAAAPPPETNQDTLHAMYGAAAGGDFESMATFFADDVRIEIRGCGPFDCEVHGKAAAVARIRANFDSVAEQQPAMRDIAADAGSVVVRVEETGRLKDERRYHVHAVQWFRFRDGLIASLAQIGDFRFV